MSSCAARDLRYNILIVEDNPDLSRHLCRLLEKRGFTCLAVANEDEAISKALCDYGAIVADIDLSEAGGDPRGGILLAERLAVYELQIRIVLISYNAQLALPPAESREYKDKLTSLRVRAVLDRNSESFREELISSLIEPHYTASERQ